MENDLIAIPEILKSLETELINSQQNREEEGRSPFFSVNSVSIELSVMVKKTESLEGGLKCTLFALTGKKQDENQNTHKVTINLDIQKQVKFGKLPHKEK